MIFRDEYVPCVHVLLAPPLASRDEQFTKGTRNDAWIGSRCAPSPARQVMDADFPVGVAGTFQLVEQLGIDHRAARFERVLMQEVGT